MSASSGLKSQKQFPVYKLWSKQVATKALPIFFHEGENKKVLHGLLFLLTQEKIIFQ